MTLRQRALELFDSLEPVDIEFMLGRWRGEIVRINPGAMALGGQQS